MSNWYYYNKNGEKVGPITVTALKALAGQGQITPQTVVENSNGRSSVAGKVNGLAFAALPTQPTQRPKTNIDTEDEFKLLPDVDEFDHTQTMKPGRKATDDLDVAMTMRPSTPPPLPNERKSDDGKNGELKRGDVLDGKYHVVKKLGQGAMGAVYKVIDDTTDVEYAIKVVLPEYIADPATLKELRTELAKAQSFTHQNLLNYKFFADAGPIQYIVMELVDGENLEEYRLRKGGKISEDEIKPIVDQILNGLGYFHGKGLVHLDLKPQNIMISKSGEVKITDYDISKSIKEQIEAGTKGGEMSAGTLCFMAPEQLNGSLCDSRTDIYALGLIIYQLLKGELPFDLKSKKAIVAWHLDPRHSFPKTDSDVFNQAIARTFSVDPNQRFTNCAKFAEFFKTGATVANEIDAVAETAAPAGATNAVDSTTSIPVAQPTSPDPDTTQDTVQSAPPTTKPSFTLPISFLITIIISRKRTFRNGIFTSKKMPRSTRKSTDSG